MLCFIKGIFIYPGTFMVSIQLKDKPLNLIAVGNRFRIMLFINQEDLCCDDSLYEYDFSFFEFPQQEFIFRIWQNLSKIAKTVSL